jgi:Secretion system C-terminal sorting domain
MKKYLLVALLGCMMSYCLMAQQTTPTTGITVPRVYRKYATQTVNAKLERDNPAITKNRAIIEQYIEKFKAQGTVQPIVIPVVFSMVYSAQYTPPTEAQITAQLGALNQCFGEAAPIIKRDHVAYKKEKFETMVGRPQVQFCLAKDVKVGNITTPTVRRLFSTTQEWTTDDKIKFTQKGGLDAIDPTQYLNIWVTKLADGVSGYAQQPGATAATDGIVIDYRFFGTTIPNTHKAYNEGKTLVHLVAGYLGVHELWNENIPCGDDGVADTPIHNSPSYEWDEYRHVSTCGNYPVKMTMNLMDNTDDAAVYMFTEGQKMRLQAILSKDGARGKLSMAGKAQCTTQPLGGRNDNPISAKLPASALNIYPNPSDYQVTVQIATEAEVPYNIVVFNTMGVIVHQSQGVATKGYQPLTLNTETWAAGVYFFHIRAKEHLYSRKVLIVD